MGKLSVTSHQRITKKSNAKPSAAAVAPVAMSIEQYKRKQQVEAANRRKRGCRKDDHAEYTVEQKNYLEHCVKKDMDPDTKLLSALREDKFLLKLDCFGEEELTAHMDFLQKCTTCCQISLSLGSVAINRDLRIKFDRLGLKKAHAYSKPGAFAVSRSACLAAYKSQHLLRLQLVGVTLPPKAHSMLAKALLHCSFLEHVSLANSSLSDAGIEAIAVALGNCVRLQQLILSGCELTDKAKLHIAKIITLHGVRKDETVWSSSLRGQSVATSTTRPELLMDLSQNALGDDAVETLCNALFHDKWLLGLNLSKNRITGRGLTLLVDTLTQSNRTLAVLTISNLKEELDKTILRNLATLLLHRKRHLKHFASESSEKRLLLGSLLLDWGVDRDLVLEICHEKSRSRKKKSSRSPSHLRQTSNNNDNEEQIDEVEDDEEYDHDRSEFEMENQYHHLSHYKNNHKQHTATSSSHIQTIEYLLERLSSLESEQRKMREYVSRVEAENLQLRQQIEELESNKTISSVEAEIIEKLETSITSLAEQVEFLEQEKIARVEELND